MEIKLYEGDLKKDAKEVRNIFERSFEDFSEEAQAAMRISGRAIFWNNYGMYNAIHPPRAEAPDAPES